MSSDIDAALRELIEAARRYNVLAARLRAFERGPDMAFVTMSSDYELDSEVIREAEHQSCRNSVSGGAINSSGCRADKKCQFCRWNARREKSLIRRAEERGSALG